MEHPLRNVYSVFSIYMKIIVAILVNNCYKTL